MSLIKSGNSSGGGGGTGPAGPQGPKGDQGDIGPQGIQGLTGPQGPSGPDGDDGGVGPAGPAGPAGVDGDVGPQGDTGGQGLTGDDGPQGPQGIQGVAGVDGEDGDVGPAGPAGATGDVGADGEIGPKGDAGNTGPQGSVGPAGPAGAQGAVGATGEDGADGADGVGGKFFVGHFGRVYCYDNDRWVTPYDDLYGPAYYQNAEHGGTAPDPNNEWEHMGEYVRAGTVVHELTMYGRISDPAAIVDMEIYVTYVYPEFPDRWDGAATTGIDNDGEVLTTLLWRGFWKAGTASTGVALNAYSGPVNDQIRRKFQFTGGDFVCPVDGQLRIYFKPVSVDPRPNTTTDFMYQTHSWLLSYS